MAKPLSAPFASWDANDHAGPVIIVTTLCLLYWTVACAIQQTFWIARGAVYNAAHTLLAASMVVPIVSHVQWIYETNDIDQIAGLIQSALILVACHNGLGRSAVIVTASKLETGRHLYRASNVFYALTLGLVKCSTACFVASLTVKNANSFAQVPRGQKRIVIVVLFLAIAWTLGSAIALGLSCTSIQTGVCMGSFNRWVGVFVGDAITDLLITAFAGNVILRTKAAIGKRLMWWTPFGLRLCVSLWAGLRLLTVNNAKFTHDPTIAIWLFVTLTQIQMMLALLSAAFPGLKQTLQDLVTRYGMAVDSTSGSKHNGSFAMKKLRTDRSETQARDNDKPRLLSFSGAEGSRVNRSRVEEDKSTGDGDSQDGIIRQDEYEVRYDVGEASDREAEGYSRSW